jgi:hypothetical protein
MNEPPEERYLAVDLAVLAAIKELAWLQQVNWHTLPSLRLVLRVVHVEPSTGSVVFGARVVRDLEEPERGFGTI